MSFQPFTLLNVSGNMPIRVLQATPGRRRFFRITTFLISGGTSIVRGLFNDIHHPTMLDIALRTHMSLLHRLKVGKVLTQVEWDKLFPSSLSTFVYVKSEDFDLT